METLKKFALNATTASLAERERLFDDLFNLLDKQSVVLVEVSEKVGDEQEKTEATSTQIPELGYKLLGKMMYYLFPVYIDKKSKQYLIELNNYLIRFSVDNALRPILASLEWHSKLALSNTSNRGIANQSLYGIDILNGLLASLLKHHPDKLADNVEEFNKLTLVYSNFVLAASIVQEKRIDNLVVKKLKQIVAKVNNLSKLFAKSIRQYPVQENELVYNRFMFCYHLLRLLPTESDGENNELKSFLINNYIDNLIGSREKPKVWLVKCASRWLSSCTRDEFNSKLLPDIKRSLLRNPEIVLESVGILFENLNIDLSDFSSDLAKSLGSQLASKDELIQAEAAQVFKSLAEQCSNNEAILSLIKFLFAILNGTESSTGKLTTQTQKCVVLTAIGNLAHNSSSQISQEIIQQLFQSFGEYLVKSETHEATVIHALNQLNVWFANLKLGSSSTLPADTLKKLNDFLKSFLVDSSKQTTFHSRSAGLRLMVTLSTSMPSLIQGLLQNTPVITACVQVVEKAAGQGTTQNYALSSEALTASLILSIFLANDTSNESKLGQYLTKITGEKSAVFSSEKFLLSLNESSLIDYCHLFEKLIELDVSHKDGRLNLSSYQTGYIYPLLHVNYKVRHQAQLVLRRLFKWIPARLLVSFLSDSFEQGLQTFSNALQATESSTNGGKWPSSKAVCEALLTFSSTPNLRQDEIETIATKSLLLCNLAEAREWDKNLYEKCLSKLLNENKNNTNANTSQLSENTNDLIQSQTDAFLKLTLQNDVLSEKELSSIETLAKLDGKNYLPRVIAYALDLVSQNSGRLMTVTRQEYELISVQDADLPHDKTLIEQVTKQLQDAQNSQQANLRRENKTYSYKEQMADLELKKEIEAKKKKASGESAQQKPGFTIEQLRAQMSKKQQEQLDAQIERERKIRDEVRSLNAVVVKSSEILKRAVRGNSGQAKLFLSQIVRSFVKLAKSPLCGPRVLELLSEIMLYEYSQNSSSQSNSTFYTSVLYCFMRLVDAPFQIDSRWTQEPLHDAYSRILTRLSGDIAADLKNGDLDLSKSSFFYPFLKFCAQNSSLDEKSMKSIVELCQTFCSHRNHLQQSLISHDLNVDNATLRQFYISDKLKQIVDNFLSTEYIALLLSLIVRSAEQKFSLNVQYLANEALNKGLFHFNQQYLFKLLNQVDKEQFVASFNSDISQINNYLSSSIFYAREACLQSLHVLINDKTSSMGCKQVFVEHLKTTVYEELVHMLILACYDSEESNRKQAGDLWTWGQFESSESLCLQLADDITHPSENVRVSAAEALAHLVKSKHTNIVAQVLNGLLSKYVKLSELPEPKKDQFGRVVEAPIDEWESREGIASTLQQLAECIPSESVSGVFKFFVISPSALNDRNSVVRNRMLDASIACLNYHGRTHINDLLPLFEQFLQEAPKEAAYDSVRQNIVILMGTLAKHLDKDDARVAPIIGKLVQALQTPSQQVQEAVANCLPPLMPSIKAQVPTYVNQLMNLLLSAPTYGERRGAAYGLAGMLKGVGMLSLRQLNVLQRLNEAVNNKQDAKQREGALIAYELLTVMFNKVFEPYSVEVLPNLLLCFGDPDANVRQAADECAKAIMANLTFTGVKMILPKLLERLGDEESWRTKCGSVELLGAMAHCAPKQLSTCLPSIVPNLIEVLSDSHVKVQKAGTQALRQIGSVIKNPEILNITNVLLEALQDPANKTQRALQVLLETKFVHFIDAPSLALIMPVVQRAFQDRSTEIRKMAAQIMGNMYSLTDQKDLLPYLPSILPGLKASLLDPVPEVRTVSSKALGSMIRVIGENGLNEILAWLMERLVSEQSSVDRSGAAQGLSEVFGALGVAKLEQAMPEIIERAAQVDLSPFVRDGYIMMFIYLPLTFGDEFIPYVGLIIQPVLKALADDSEFVRDTAIKAGQRIVNTYADTAISLFLPELEKGLFDINWRIRYSSVQLLGDLLYKISGVAGKMTTESAHEDDNFGTEKGSTAIISALGEDRRNRIYSGLYMGRSDTSLQVRQASLHVWKVIVSNTPRTLKEILPTLFNILLSCLASANPGRRQIAAGTLVDIVRKLGERILPDIIPILEHGLKSGERSEQRQGVCIGLSEIMANISKDNVMAFSDSLVPTVRLALMDPLIEVRAAGARTFDNLHAMIGVKALEEVVLYLYNEMRQHQQAGSHELAERALDGLKQLMLVKSRACLPFLVPYLTQPPVDIQSLCALCSCANIEILGRHLNKILHTLVQALAINYQKSETESNVISNDQWINDCEVLLVSVQDPDGIRSIVHDLLQQITDSKSNTSTKLAALDMLNWFCSKTEADYSAHVDDLVKNMLNLFVEKNDKILLKAWTCLNSCIDTLKGIALIQRLPVIRQTLRLLTQFHFSNQTQEYYSHTMSESSPEVIKNYKLYLLPGFCIPKKGLTCLLPIFKEGLLNGPPDVKEQSALTLCECIKLADGDSLKPSVMNITGPLIRVLGERYNWSIKSAILDAIYFLLLKVDITLKPFLPQLQPTFMKNLVDANRVVRIKSGCALAKLLLMNPRLDTIVLEIQNNLLKSTTNVPDQATKETLINSLRLCLNNVGGKLQEDTKNQLLQFLLSDAYLYNATEHSIRAVSAGAIGSLLVHLSEASLNQVLGDMLNYEKYGPSAGKTGWIYVHSNCMSLSAVIKQSPSTLLKRADLLPKLSSFIQHCANHDRAPVTQSAIRAITFILDYYVRENKPLESVLSPLPELLVRCVNMSTSSAEIKELSIHLLTYITVRNVNDEKSIEDETLLRAFVTMLINGARERSPSVRLNSEVALVRLLKLAPNKAATTKQINLESPIYQKCLQLLSAMRDSVEDSVRSLSKESLSHSINLNDYHIDETILRLD